MDPRSHSLFLRRAGPGPTPAPTPLGAIGTDASGILLTQGGQPWSPVGVTAFDLAEHWMRGHRPKVDAFTAWMRAHRLQIARVFGMYNAGTGAGVGYFFPQGWGLDYFQQMAELADYLADQGLVLDLDLFCDMQTDDVHPNNPLSEIDQPAFFNATASALTGKWNVILAGGNQEPKNGYDSSRLAWPQGRVRASRGSVLEDGLPKLPPWDDSEFHPARLGFTRKFKSRWDLLTGNTTEGVAVPGGVRFTEPIGVGPVNEDNRTTNDPWQMWQFAAGSRVFGVSALYVHMRLGITADIPVAGTPDGDRVNAVVDAAVDGFTRAPGGYGLGDYARGQAPNEPYNATIGFAHDDAWAERTYELRLGARSAVIIVNPTPANPFRLQDGAQILRSVGYGHGYPDTVFELAR